MEVITLSDYLIKNIKILKENYENIWQYYDEYSDYDEYLNKGPLLFNGSSDISSKGQIGDFTRIPIGSAWALTVSQNHYKKV
jgi:hypothetical protein